MSRAFGQVFILELRTLMRTKTAWLLLGFSVAWMLGFPHLLRGDGTAEGAREIYLHYSLGGVFALTVMTLVASAAGTFARERSARRLQLTLIRPVPYFLLAAAKIAAHVLVGAVVLAVAAGMVLVHEGAGGRCQHVLRPIMPSAAEEAKTMYSAYMVDPQTPDAIRKAGRAAVLRILEQKAIDHYESIPTNATVRWRFTSAGDALRLRFTNNFEMRQEMRGILRSGAATLSVSNMTQAVMTIPFAGESGELEFTNRGAQTLMLRPRRDIEVLVAADGFAANLARAVLELVAALTLLVALSALLSAGLGRPVALFVAFSILLVGEVSPSVVAEYPNELEAGPVDAIGLFVARSATEITRPIATLSPLADLSRDVCLERAQVVRALAVDALLLPVLLTLLAAFVLPRKQQE